MASSGNDYLVQRGKQIERRKRIVTYIFVMSFGGSILFGGLNFVQRAWEQPQKQVVNTVATELSQQAKGYELVLKKEPNNQNVMEKLSIVRLKLGDNKGAIAMMEKLAQQHPERQDYKTLLVQVKQREGQTQPR